MRDKAVILTGVRTPMGAMSGALASVSAPQLGAACIRALIARTGIAGGTIDEVIMGNVIGAGLGQNPARQAAIFAGLPESVGAVTVNKVCGSGLKAVMLADQAIRAGDAGIVVAGGMESMTRAPYLLTKAREGYRLGHGELLDAMILDGLWDVYGQKHMGTCGDACALKYEFSRREQDDFAVRSHTRARQAIAEGVFDDEIVPVEISLKGKTTVVSADEGPAKFDEAKLRALKPAFGSEGTITAGNASSISDGAAALLVASRRDCDALGSSNLSPRSSAPPRSASSPNGSRPHPSRRFGSCSTRSAGRSTRSISSRSTRRSRSSRCSPSVSCEFLPDKVNIMGGAVALGHPIGVQWCADPGHALACIEANRRPARHRQPVHRRRRSHRLGHRDDRLSQRKRLTLAIR